MSWSGWRHWHRVSPSVQRVAAADTPLTSAHGSPSTDYPWPWRPLGAVGASGSSANVHLPLPITGAIVRRSWYSSSPAASRRGVSTSAARGHGESYASGTNLSRNGGSKRLVLSLRELSA